MKKLIRILVSYSRESNQINKTKHHSIFNGIEATKESFENNRIDSKDSHFLSY